VCRITVTDTGCGIAFDHIPKLLGQVFGSTNIQAESGHSAGKFGIACKAILLYAASGSPLTSNELKVLTSTQQEQYISEVCMAFANGSFDIISAKRSRRITWRSSILHVSLTLHPQASEEG
jgi:DNA topoisomerase VI subunit B